MLPELPSAERKVGRALLLHSPTLGLESSLRLAEIVGTSGATVIRFVNRLGYATYADFQQEWRVALDARLVTPTETYRETEPDSDPIHRVMRSAQAASASIERTIRELPEQEVDTAIRLLVDGQRIFTCGGWYSQVLARHTVALLQGIRPGVSLLEEDAARRTATLVDANKRDVAVVFDFRRYEQGTLVAAQQFAAQKARVVLVTDQWISPIAGLAGAVLIARTDPSAPMQELAGAMLIMEALAWGVAEELGGSVGDRIERIGQISSQLIPNWANQPRSS